MLPSRQFYGWSADINDDDALRELLELNGGS